MKQLIRKFSRVADSSSYFLLRSESASGTPSKWRRLEQRRARGRRSSRCGAVPQGHVPVYVGEEMERFIVSAELLNRPVFVELLKKSAQEYGYEQQGVLRIPCAVFVFERVLEVLKERRFDGVEEDMEIVRLFFPDEFGTVNSLREDDKGFRFSGAKGDTQHAWVAVPTLSSEFLFLGTNWHLAAGRVISFLLKHFPNVAEANSVISVALGVVGEEIEIPCLQSKSWLGVGWLEVLSSQSLSVSNFPFSTCISEYYWVSGTRKVNNNCGKQVSKSRTQSRWEKPGSSAETEEERAEVGHGRVIFGGKKGHRPGHTAMNIAEAKIRAEDSECRSATCIIGFMGQGQQGCSAKETLVMAIYCIEIYLYF
ncbi:hypothetical protein H6P81_019103 [Aristolochia fimbriata]|uniref:Small auxin up regulated protein n=1 Tax=Aristolochia fimbriata TaxID=158543 RepID=A0AAV7DQR7_ARIFI|nr:hypothetical protein H6P81_019103 [Aristolochia fimbriata]